jgi:hypothetical protein
MSGYFSHFPSLQYSGTTVKNITLKANLIDSFKQTATNFYPYTISDGETADSIAYDYYGDPNYVWIIYLTNDIIDPYYDWPLSILEFDEFIKSKYGSIEQAKSTTAYYKKIPVDYYVNDITNEFILASLYNPTTNGYNWSKVTVDENIKISSATTPDPAVWQAVDVYSDELEKNEEKRYIKLLDERFVVELDRKLKDVLYG